MTKQTPNKTNKIDTTNKIIIPKWGKDSLSDEARKKLVEDLQNISPEEIEEIGENFDRIKEEKEKEKKKELEEERREKKKNEKIRKEKLREELTKLIKEDHPRERHVELVEIYEYWDIWWKPAFKVKDADWWYRVYRWDKEYWFRSKEIWEIKNIWWKPAFKVKDAAWYYNVFRWDTCCWGLYDIWDIKEIWWQPVFKWKQVFINWVWNYLVIRWDKLCWYTYKEIWEIKDIWWKPVFWGRDNDGYRHEIEWRHEIS